MTAINFGVYFDTGVLIKLYHLEAGSGVVAAKVRAYNQLPLPFLCEMELRNALRVLHGRGVLDAVVLRRSLAALDEDIDTGRLNRVVPDPIKLQVIAEELSKKYASATLCRTLDLLHVAAACVLEVKSMVTGDLRQARLAEQSGLKVDFIQVGA